MASVPSKTNGGSLPPGYVSPFKREQMVERIDDSLCCVAMLTNRTLSEIKEQAFKFGLPRTGPAWVFNDMIAKLLFQYGLVGGEYKEVDSLSGMPDVAILMVDYNRETDIGRHVVWHHVRGTPEQAAFHYVIDPLAELDPKHHRTSDFKHLQIEAPIYYLAVSPRPDTTMARKGK